MSYFRESSLDINICKKEIFFSMTVPIINYVSQCNNSETNCILFKCIIGIVFIILIASIYEYSLHRFVMHNKNNKIGKAHVEHHLETNSDMSLKYTSKYLDKNDKNRNLVIRYDASILFFITLTIIGLFIWKFFVKSNYCIPIILSFLLTCYTSIVWNSVHPQMHGEKGYNGEKGIPGIIPLKYLGFFEKHHRIHHKSKGTKNFNITIPIVDYLINFLS